MQTLSRREFAQQALGSVLTLSLLETLFRCDAFADEAKSVTIKWLADVNQLGRDLKDQKLEQVEWQKKIEELYAGADIADFLRLIDFNKLTKNLELLDSGAKSLEVKFPKLQGLPEKFAWGRQIFALKEGRSVVPHGHNNMATAFLILKGSLHGRHYDRLEDEDEHVLIKPTIDRQFKLGECSTVSDYKDNVHWFKALDEPAFIFNIHVSGLDPESDKTTGRVYIDPAGEKLKDGVIRARLIDSDEAHKLYG